jgi:hypothetical protein
MKPAAEMAGYLQVKLINSKNPPSPPFLKVGYRGNLTAKTMGYLEFNKNQNPLRSFS